MKALVAAGAGALLLAPPAAGALDRTGFRYSRQLHARPGPVLLEPDKALYAHARVGLADLRIVDARGRRVPWRRLPSLAEARSIPVQLLNRGRQRGKAVALIDLGPVRRVHDRIEIEVRDQGFVGSVEVLGSDDRRGFTSLSTTPIYDVHGARDARSTTAVFPPTDFRYLLIRATGVNSISGATVAYDPSRPPLRPVEARTEIRQIASTTVVDLDLGFSRVPVDRLDFETTTPRFDRPVTVSGSDDGRRFTPVGGGEVTRFSSVSLTALPLSARSRYLRVTISNGDDPPLAGLEVAALARPRTLLLAEGFRPPYRLFYGDSALGPPDYDFAALPRAQLGLRRATTGSLEREALNARFEPPQDTRSFAARHPVVLQAALALAAIAVAGGGVLALRRRA